MFIISLRCAVCGRGSRNGKHSSAALDTVRVGTYRVGTYRVHSHQKRSIWWCSQFTRCKYLHGLRTRCILCLWFRASLNYINNCPTRCNTKQSIYYSASSLYMFRASTTPIIRSTQNCNYSLRYWS